MQCPAAHVAPLLLLLLAVGFCAAGGERPVANDQPRERSHGLAHITACVLAGGWCPVGEGQPAAWRNFGTNGGSKQPSPSPRSPRQDHKPLLPLSGLDALAFLLAGLSLLLAASGGIGGGGILVPLYLMVLGFSTSGAVALSNITIMGGALSNLCFNMGRVHPLRHGRPLIDWDLILVMEPSTILGALLGGYLNKVLPSWLTTASLSLLLAAIAAKVALKAADIRGKEQRALGYSLARLSVVDAEGGGEFMETLRTPLLSRFASLDKDAGSASGGSRGSSRGGRGEFREASPSPLGPLLQRPASAASSGMTSEEGCGWGGALAETALAAEATATGSTGTGSLLSPAAPEWRRPPPSEPVAIIDVESWGAQSGNALPFLSPIMNAEATQLAAGEQQQHPLCGAGGLEIPPKGGKGGHSAAAAAGQHAAAGHKQGGHGMHSGMQRRGIAWKPRLPWLKVAILLALLAGVVGTDLLKMHARCPSLDYWLRATAMVPITLASLAAVRVFLLRKGAERRAAGYQPLEGEVEWTPPSTLLYPVLCSLAGLCAGVFGVGGGIIKGPLMLEMGVLPEVAAATSATMILFTSVSASVVFISFGAFQWDYAAALLALGVVATAAGQLLVLCVHRHLSSRSLLVAVMAAVLGASSLALAVQGGRATLVAARAHELWSFHSICGAAAAAA